MSIFEEEHLSVPEDSDTSLCAKWKEERNGESATNFDGWREKILQLAWSQGGVLFDEVKIVPGNSVMHASKGGIWFESFIRQRNYQRREDSMRPCETWNKYYYAFVVPNDDGYRLWVSFKGREELDAISKKPLALEGRARVISDVLTHMDEGEGGKITEEELDKSALSLWSLDDSRLCEEWSGSVGEWLCSRDDVGPGENVSHTSWIDQQLVCVILGLPRSYGYCSAGVSYSVSRLQELSKQNQGAVMNNE